MKNTSSGFKNSAFPPPSRSGNLTNQVDESVSQFPFLQVYRSPGATSLEDSLAKTIESEAEIILATLIVTNRFGKHQLLAFTNRRILAVNKRNTLWDVVWSLFGIVEKIPVVGWLIAIGVDLIGGLMGGLFKRAERTAKKLITVDRRAILDVESKTKKIAKGIFATPLEYRKLVQPSSGLSIRRRWFANYLSKIRAATVRFIPIGRVQAKLSSLIDAADFVLPDQSILPKLARVFDALATSLPFEEIEVITVEDCVDVQWPPSLGVGDKRVSALAASAICFLCLSLTIVTLLVGLSGDEVALWLALYFGLMSISTIPQRRFSDAFLVVFVYALIFLAAILKEL